MANSGKPHCLSIVLHILLTLIVGGVVLGVAIFRDSQIIAGLGRAETGLGNLKDAVAKIQAKVGTGMASGNVTDEVVEEVMNPALDDLKKDLIDQIQHLDDKVDQIIKKAAMGEEKYNQLYKIGLLAACVAGLSIVLFIVTITMLVCWKIRKNRGEP